VSRLMSRVAALAALTNLTNTRHAFCMSTKSVNLYEAKTQLSKLVDEAADGAEIVIAKNGVPRAMLVAAASPKRRRKPANALKIVRIADDFDAVDLEIAMLFEGRED
jgi:prevent-host-death family protein